MKVYRKGEKFLLKIAGYLAEYPFVSAIIVGLAINISLAAALFLIQGENAIFLFAPGGRLSALLAAIIVSGPFIASYSAFLFIRYINSYRHIPTAAPAPPGAAVEAASSGIRDARADGDLEKRAHEPLFDAARKFIDLTEFLDRTLKRYDPVNFRLERHYRAIMRSLLRDEHDADPSGATHIFLATRRPDGNYEGSVYKKSNGLILRNECPIYDGPTDRTGDGRILRNECPIIVDAGESRVAILRGEKDVIWSNWEDEGSSLDDYQRNFHEAVRAEVGIIERFATYQSGDVAIIAFYKGMRVERLQAYLLKSLAVFANSLTRISDEIRETEDAFVYTVEALARAAEANDEDTGEHIIRVNEYSRALAEALGMDADFVRKIHYSAQMHDVGKIHVHPDILRKPGPLTEEETSLMQLHTTYGVHILGDSPRLAMASEIARSHHERFSGGGYPAGLKGAEIPLAGRIVRIADVYDALRQKRTYKRAFSHDEAVRIITRGDAGTDPSHFDPEVLDAFVRIQNEMKEIFVSCRSRSAAN